jgi:hypothetical protein
VRSAALLLLLALAACDSARPSTCLENPAGTFHFTGVLTPGDAGVCPFAADAGLSFIAEVALPQDTTSEVCVRNNDASRLEGTRSGDHITVTTDPFPAVNLTGCTCGVQITEKLDGDLTRGADGGFSGFTGTLTDSAAPSPDAGPDAAPCNANAPDAGPSCGLPCDVKWQVTGS